MSVLRYSIVVVASVLYMLTAYIDNRACASSTEFKPCPFPNFTAAVDRFSKVIEFRTVSDRSASSHARYPEEFTKLNTFLQAAYPGVRVWLHVPFLLVLLLVLLLLILGQGTTLTC
jgi:hypothetical protein